MASFAESKARQANGATGNSRTISECDQGKPSRTAEFVAFNRALGTLAPQVPGFSDPFAYSLPSRPDGKGR